MDINSLAHTKWECKYHIVFAPKYRRQVIYKDIKADVGQILGTLCRRKGIEIIEAECMPDHILEMVFNFLRIHIDLDFIKISMYMPSVYMASNDISSVLPCLVVLCGYLILSVFAGFRILKLQDIK